MKKILVIIFTLFSGLVYSQETEVLLEKAELFYSQEEYALAIPVLNDLLLRIKNDPELIQRRGNCYFETGQYEKALKDYKKVKYLRPNKHDTYYKLGSTYSRMSLIDSAIFYFKEYTKLNPADAHAYNRLSILFMEKQNGNDSAVYYAEKAVETAPGNPQAYYTLSLSRMYQREYQKSIETAKKGIEKDPEYYLLYQPLGLSYFYLRDYEKSYNYFHQGMEPSNNNPEMINYTALSRVYSNTSVKTYFFDKNDKIRFSFTQSSKPEQLLLMTKNESSGYHYPSLLQKFNDTPGHMGLDEFFMLYLGFSDDPNYSPGSEQRNDLNKLFKREDYLEYIKETELYLAKNPADFTLYKDLSLAYEITGFPEKQYINLVKYYGFKESVMATGDGIQPGSAFIVIFPHHEYNIIGNESLEIMEVNREKSGTQMFDIIRVKNNDLSEQSDVYFNITRVYQAALEKRLKK